MAFQNRLAPILENPVCVYNHVWGGDRKSADTYVPSVLLSSLL